MEKEPVVCGRNPEIYLDIDIKMSYTVTGLLPIVTKKEGESMSRKSGKDETLTGIQLPARSEQGTLQTVWAKYWETFARWSYRVSGRMVALSALVRKRVLIPALLYLFALTDVCAKGARRLWLELVCCAHELRVAAGRLKANRITAACIMASLTVLAISSSFFGLGFSLSINGEEVGYIMSAEDLNLAVANVEKQVSSALGRPYGLHPNTTLSFGLVERDRVLDQAELEGKLVSAVSDIAEMYVLTVDGEPVGASYQEGALRKLVDGMGAVPEGYTVLKTTYNRDVKIEQTVAQTSLLKSEEELSEILTGDIGANQYYTIRRGDTWEGVAQAHGLSVEQLKALNPNQSLKRGKQLLVQEALPFLSVEKIVRKSEIKTIAYGTVKTESDSMYVGTQKVESKGIPGNARVTTNYTYKDGECIGSEQVDYEVLKEPVDEVVKVGTKPLPRANSMSASGDGISTGNLIRPVSGAIVYSDYGYRKSGFHTGIDFAVAAGTAVRAADGGTVTYAGYKGDFGYLVIISHGNGLTTYYAHNSANLVKVGQKVSRGQRIAKVGSTGNSTGPHCHFEVRRNGKNVNPWRYIS